MNTHSKAADNSRTRGRRTFSSLSCHSTEWRFVMPNRWRAGAIVLSVLVGTIPAQLTLAQTQSFDTLQQAQTTLLRSNCAGLNGGQAGTFGNLRTKICNIATGGALSGRAGSGASAQTFGVSVLNSTARQRMEGERGEEEEERISLGERLSVFMTANFEALNKDRTRFEDGFDSNIYGVTGGGDYRFSDQLLGGLAFNWTNTNGDFDGGGDFSYNLYGSSLYAIFQPRPDVFAQLSAGYGRQNYLVKRRSTFNTGPSIVRGFSSSNTDGNIATTRALLGYDHSINRYTIGPRLGFNYSHTHIDGYSEKGNTGLELRYGDQHVDSVQTEVGLQGSAAFSTGFGVLVPQVNADYIHEYDNSQRNINVRFVEDASNTRFRFKNDKPVRNFFNLSIGVVAVLPQGWQPFVNFRAMAANRHYQNYAGTVGVRLEM